MCWECRPLGGSQPLCLCCLLPQCLSQTALYNTVMQLCAWSVVQYFDAMAPGTTGFYLSPTTVVSLNHLHCECVLAILYLALLQSCIYNISTSHQCSPTQIHILHISEFKKKFSQGYSKRKPIPFCRINSLEIIQTQTKKRLFLSTPQTDTAEGILLKVTPKPTDIVFALFW